MHTFIYSDPSYFGVASFSEGFFDQNLDETFRLRQFYNKPVSKLNPVYSID